MRTTTRLIALLAVVTTLVAGTAVTAEARTAAGPARITVCHIRGNGTAVPLQVAARVLPRHLGHGDAMPGDEARPGYVYDDTCTPVRQCPAEGDFVGTFLNEFRFPMTLTIWCDDIGQVIADVDYPVWEGCSGTWTLDDIDGDTIWVTESIELEPCGDGWTYEVTYDPEADMWRGYYLVDPTKTFRLRRA